MTTQTKHSPGPWATNIKGTQELIRKGEKLDGATIYSPGGDEVATIRHDPDDNLDLIGKDADEHAANARLLAAAPELADALRLALPSLKGNQNVPSVKKAYDAALSILLRLEA